MLDKIIAVFTVAMVLAVAISGLIYHFSGKHCKKLEDVNMDFESIKISKARSYDNNINIYSKQSAELIIVVGLDNSLHEILHHTTLSVMEAAEIAYVYNNLTKIYAQL